MMRILILGLSFGLLLGCEGYSVELDPAWEDDSSETNTADPTTEDPSAVDPSTEDPSTEEPTDTDPPWIELSEDDDATDPDDTDPSISDDCEDIICSDQGPFCYDTLAVDCCPACEAGSRSCNGEIPMNYYQEQYICAGGCWEIETLCDNDSYCKEDASGELNCVPLPTTYDDFCDPQFEYMDPDCQTCSVCDYPGESYCSRTGISPDALIQCVDFTGYGHYCWSYELCSSSGFDNFCVEDFAQNLAACTGYQTSEEICSQFICTGVETCGSDGAGTITDCGYCGTCCDSGYDTLCGYGGTAQSSSTVLTYNSETFCYESADCDEQLSTDPGSNYCRISEVGAATCEPANFFGP